MAHSKRRPFYTPIIVLATSVLIGYAGVPVFGQTVSISGTVKNKTTGAAIPGANVLLEGTAFATTSGINGQFTLSGQLTGTLASRSNTSRASGAVATQRGIVINLPSPGDIDAAIFSLKGAAVASIHQSGLTRGQWIFSPRLTPGTYFCCATVNGLTTRFKFQRFQEYQSRSNFQKVCDAGETPLPLAKSALEAYSLAVSKSRFMTSRTALAGGVATGLVVSLDTIMLTTGMTDQQARDALRALIGTDSILFIKRATLKPTHFYSEFFDATWLPGGAICALNLKTGAVRQIITGTNFTGGVFKHFDLSYDAKKIVFAFKKSTSTGYRIYEAEIATGVAKALTTPPANEDSLKTMYGRACGSDDIDPCYLPDGGIMFASTRCQVSTICDAGDNLVTTNIYRMDGDGKNMRRLSKSLTSEFQPSVLPDGRILYSRWEYVDKASGAIKCLWLMYPNGAGSAEVYGNDICTPPAMVQGRAIPGAQNKYVMLATPHYPAGQYGTVVRLNMNKYIRSREPMEFITKEVDAVDHGTLAWPLAWGKGNTYRDPYPLAEDLFLVSHKPGTVAGDWSVANGYGLYVLTGDNKTAQLYRDSATSCFEPFPFQTRPREPLVNIPLDSALAAKKQAVCTVNDIYFNMENVPRGSIKYIKIMAQVQRPWAARHFWGNDVSGLQHAAIARETHISVKVSYGIVPVESDGSANFLVPANEAVYFQALDSNYQCVQYERTYVNYMPGERRSCAGCHETPDQVPPVPTSIPLAMRRAPSEPLPLPGDLSARKVLHYPDYVQPVWNKYCVKCHNPVDKKGNLDLTDSITTLFTTSYEQLMDRKDWLLGWFIDESPRNPIETSCYLPANSVFSNCILLKMLGVKMTLKDKVVPSFPGFTCSYPNCGYDHPGKWASQYGARADTLTAKHSGIKLTKAEIAQISTWVQTNYQYRGSYWGRFNSSFRAHADFRPKVNFDQVIGTKQPIPDH